MIYDGYAIFTPGPVKMSKEILAIGAMQTPYFRNQPFSDVLLECEELLLEFVNAPSQSRVVFLTASGTAGMEAVVMNLLDQESRALVVNGGGFGQRFVDICQSYTVPHQEIRADGEDLSNVEGIDAKGFDTFIVNAHETSVGHLYDLDAIGAYCQKNALFNIVDAISMFVTDPLDMQKQSIDTLIVSSQKGLGLPPGLTMVVLTPRAIAQTKEIKGHYFNFRNYLRDGERGQTPYTPAVTILLQLQARLKQIKADGGIEGTIRKAKEIAGYFRENIKDLPLKAFSPFMPNAMTTLTPTDGRSAAQIVRDLEVQYKVIVCPNGGELGDAIFRVAHMGDMNEAYVDILLDALRKYYKSNVIAEPS